MGVQPRAHYTGRILVPVSLSAADAPCCGVSEAPDVVRAGTSLLQCSSNSDSPVSSLPLHNAAATATAATAAATPAAAVLAGIRGDSESASLAASGRGKLLREANGQASVNSSGTSRHDRNNSNNSNGNGRENTLSPVIVRQVGQWCPDKYNWAPAKLLLNDSGLHFWENVVSILDISSVHFLPLHGDVITNENNEPTVTSCPHGERGIIGKEKKNEEEEEEGKVANTATVICAQQKDNTGLSTDSTSSSKVDLAVADTTNIVAPRTNSTCKLSEDNSASVEGDSDNGDAPACTASTAVAPPEHEKTTLLQHSDCLVIVHLHGCFPALSHHLPPFYSIASFTSSSSSATFSTTTESTDMCCSTSDSSCSGNVPCSSSNSTTDVTNISHKYDGDSNTEALRVAGAAAAAATAASTAAEATAAAGGHTTLVFRLKDNVEDASTTTQQDNLQRAVQQRKRGNGHLRKGLQLLQQTVQFLSSVRPMFRSIREEATTAERLRSQFHALLLQHQHQQQQQRGKVQELRAYSQPRDTGAVGLCTALQQLQQQRQVAETFYESLTAEQAKAVASGFLLRDCAALEEAIAYTPLLVYEHLKDAVVSLVAIPTSPSQHRLWRDVLQAHAAKKKLAAAANGETTIVSTRSLVHQTQQQQEWSLPPQNLANPKVSSLREATSCPQTQHMQHQSSADNLYSTAGIVSASTATHFSDAAVSGALSGASSPESSSSSSSSADSPTTIGASSPESLQSPAAVDASSPTETHTVPAAEAVGAIEGLLNAAASPSATDVTLAASPTTTAGATVAACPPTAVGTSENKRKNEATLTMPFTLIGGGCRIPKGVQSPCEDAVFLLEDEGVFGVFDGVGSWAAEGVDASRFSNGLADACVTIAKTHFTPAAKTPATSPRSSVPHLRDEVSASACLSCSCCSPATNPPSRIAANGVSQHQHPTVVTTTTPLEATPLKGKGGTSNTQTLEGTTTRQGAFVSGSSSETEAISFPLNLASSSPVTGSSSCGAGASAGTAAVADMNVETKKRCLRFAALDANERARELLRLAHAKVRYEQPDAWGSSTAVVGVFDRSHGKLGVACLGDSVLMVLRRQLLPKSMQHRSSTQNHNQDNSSRARSTVAYSGERPLSDCCNNSNANSSSNCNENIGSNRNTTSTSSVSAEVSRSTCNISDGASDTKNNNSSSESLSTECSTDTSLSSESSYTSNSSTGSNCNGLNNNNHNGHTGKPGERSILSKLSPRNNAAVQLLSRNGAPRVLRKVRWRSVEQRWSNGAPYQLSNLPAAEEWDSLRQQGHGRFVDVLERIDAAGDSADLAAAAEHPLVLQPGDLILLFSDGVADNLFDREIEVFASFPISPEDARAAQLPLSAVTHPKDIATMICKAALRRAADRAFEKPFTPATDDGFPASFDFRSASAAADERRKGAKKDDISCLALWVCATSDSNSTTNDQPAAADFCNAATAPPATPAVDSPAGAPVASATVVTSTIAVASAVAAAKTHATANSTKAAAAVRAGEQTKAAEETEENINTTANAKDISAAIAATRSTAAAAENIAAATAAVKNTATAAAQSVTAAVASEAPPTSAEDLILTTTPSRTTRGDEGGGIASVVANGVATAAAISAGTGGGHDGAHGGKHEATSTEKTESSKSQSSVVLAAAAAAARATALSRVPTSTLPAADSTTNETTSYEKTTQQHDTAVGEPPLQTALTSETVAAGAPAVCVTNNLDAQIGSLKTALDATHVSLSGAAAAVASGDENIKKAITTASMSGIPVLSSLKQHAASRAPPGDAVVVAYCEAGRKEEGNVDRGSPATLAAMSNNPTAASEEAPTGILQSTRIPGPGGSRPCNKTGVFSPSVALRHRVAGGVAATAAAASCEGDYEEATPVKDRVLTVKRTTETAATATVCTQAETTMTDAQTCTEVAPVAGATRGQTPRKALTIDTTTPPGTPVRSDGKIYSPTTAAGTGTLSTDILFRVPEQKAIETEEKAGTPKTARGGPLIKERGVDTEWTALPRTPPSSTRWQRTRTPESRGPGAASGLAVGERAAAAAAAALRAGTASVASHAAAILRRFPTATGEDRESLLPSTPPRRGCSDSSAALLMQPNNINTVSVGSRVGVAARESIVTLKKPNEKHAGGVTHAFLDMVSSPSPVRHTNTPRKPISHRQQSLSQHHQHNTDRSPCFVEGSTTGIPSLTQSREKMSFRRQLEALRTPGKAPVATAAAAATSEVNENTAENSTPAAAVPSVSEHNATNTVAVPAAPSASIDFGAAAASTAFAMMGPAAPVQSAHAAPLHQESLTVAEKGHVQPQELQQIVSERADQRKNQPKKEPRSQEQGISEHQPQRTQHRQFDKEHETALSHVTVTCERNIEAHRVSPQREIRRILPHAETAVLADKSNGVTAEVPPATVSRRVELLGAASIAATNETALSEDQHTPGSARRQKAGIKKPLLEHVNEGSARKRRKAATYSETTHVSRPLVRSVAGHPQSTSGVRAPASSTKSPTKRSLTPTANRSEKKEASLALRATTPPAGCTPPPTPVKIRDDTSDIACSPLRAAGEPSDNTGVSLLPPSTLVHAVAAVVPQPMCGSPGHRGPAEKFGSNACGVSSSAPSLKQERHYRQQTVKLRRSLKKHACGNTSQHMSAAVGTSRTSRALTPLPWTAGRRSVAGSTAKWGPVLSRLMQNRRRSRTADNTPIKSLASPSCAIEGCAPTPNTTPEKAIRGHTPTSSARRTPTPPARKTATTPRRVGEEADKLRETTSPSKKSVVSTGGTCLRGEEVGKSETVTTPRKETPPTKRSGSSAAGARDGPLILSARVRNADNMPGGKGTSVKMANVQKSSLQTTSSTETVTRVQSDGHHSTVEQQLPQGRQQKPQQQATNTATATAATRLTNEAESTSTTATSCGRAAVPPGKGRVAVVSASATTARQQLLLRHQRQQQRQQLLRAARMLLLRRPTCPGAAKDCAGTPSATRYIKRQKASHLKPRGKAFAPSSVTQTAAGAPVGRSNDTAAQEPSLGKRTSETTGRATISHPAAGISRHACTSTVTKTTA